MNSSHRSAPAEEAEPRRWLKVTEAARLLDVSKDTVYRMVHNDELPHRTVRGMIRIPVDAVKQALDED